MISYIFGLLSAISFGISNNYWKNAVSSASFPGLVFFRGIIASTCFGIAWFVFTKTTQLPSSFINENATLQQYGVTVILCVACSMGLVFYLKSLNYSPVSISAPLSSINIFGILTAVIVLHENFLPIYWFSFGIGIVGALLSQSYSIYGTKFSWNIGGTYAIIASFFWGTTYTLFKYSAKWLGAIPLAFILETTVLTTAFIWIQISDKYFFRSKTILSSKNLKHYFVLAIFLLFGTLFFNLAVQKLPILIINLFGFFTLFVSISTGILFYQEKLNFKQVIGIIFLVVSIFAVKY